MYICIYIYIYTSYPYCILILSVSYPRGQGQMSLMDWEQVPLQWIQIDLSKWWTIAKRWETVNIPLFIGFLLHPFDGGLRSHPQYLIGKMGI